MLHRRVWRYKWLVLASFEKHMGDVRYAEIIGPHEKRYQFGPLSGFYSLPFCVSIAYAKLAWTGELSTYPKSKATHLIVRPHLRKEWDWPLSSAAERERGEMCRFQEHLSGNSKTYAGELQSKDTLAQWAGIEIILSAADIEKSPDQAYTEWLVEASPYCSDQTRVATSLRL